MFIQCTLTLDVKHTSVLTLLRQGIQKTQKKSVKVIDFHRNGIYNKNKAPNRLALDWMLMHEVRARTKIFSLT
jgi:hypothetical protein